MQEGNWGDIEKVFQKTHVYLWFIVNFQFFSNRSSLRPCADNADTHPNKPTKAAK